MIEQEVLKLLEKYPIMGVRYNVIRRPLSGGAGSIRQHKPTKGNPMGETKDQFYTRLRDDYIAKEPQTFFMRWTVGIQPSDITRFRKETLDPILEQLCDWYQVMVPSGNCEAWGGSGSYHFTFPYGIYSPLTDGGGTDLDEYINSGSVIGLERVDTLFRELQ